MFNVQYKVEIYDAVIVVIMYYSLFFHGIKYVVSYAVFIANVPM